MPPFAPSALRCPEHVASGNACDEPVVQLRQWVQITPYGRIPRSEVKCAAGHFLDGPTSLFWHWFEQAQAAVQALTDERRHTLLHLIVLLRIILQSSLSSGSHSYKAFLHLRTEFIGDVSSDDAHLWITYIVRMAQLAAAEAAQESVAA
jgi:hypothetical protein